MEFPTFINRLVSFHFKGCTVVFYIFIQISIEHSVSNSGDPDQTSHSVASDLGLHCLPMFHEKDARLIWVKGDPALLFKKNPTIRLQS